MGSIQRLKQKSKNMHGSALGPLQYMLWLLAWHFCGTPESGDVSDSSDWFWDPSLSTGLTCSIIMSGFEPGLIVSCAMFS